MAEISEMPRRREFFVDEAGIGMRVTHKHDLRRSIDALRSGQAVILDVSHVPSELRHRMLDYISGGCSSVSARMERIATNVYLLDPPSSTRE